MKKLYGKTWAKALALCLFALFALLSLFFAMCYRVAAYEGVLRDSATFQDTLGQVYVYDDLRYVSQYIQWTGDVDGSLAQVSGYCGDTFGYVVQEGGVRQAFNVGDGAVPAASGMTAQYGTHTYELTGYLNLPASPYGGCYAEYVLFRFLSALGGWLAALAALCAALSAAALAFCVLAAGRGKNGPARGGLNRLPPEAFALLCLALPALEELAAQAGAWYSLPDAFLWLESVVGLWCWIAALGAMGVSLAARLRTGGLGDSWLGRLASKLSRTARLTVGMTLFFAAQVVVVGWGADFSAILLLLMDAGAMALALRRNAQLKKLRTAAGALASGRLDYQTRTKGMPADLQAFGDDLNRIGEGMSAAVAERLKSERMKTELITNVSHDLKTPLTSIVTYIDLLKKEELPGEKAREYVAVLERQSARLKKLTEDLVEASKAASGALSVTKEPLDAGELLTQSVGEYGERLTAAGVTPVVNVPGEPVTLVTDGRLLWRVMDNLIGNVVKYALPGTRAYFDLTRTERGARIDVKNISRQSLNIPAEELMERFVRGDSSRSTEGSGLGLAIAKSLTELLGGRFTLTLDGDLFKATLEWEA